MVYAFAEALGRFRDAVAELDALFAGDQLSDENVAFELRKWLDGNAKPLPWTYP